MSIETGVKVWEKNEAMVPVFLGVHGLLVLLYIGGESWQWLLAGSIVFLGLWSLNPQLSRRISIELKAGAILVSGWLLMLGTGGATSFFAIWLVPLVAFYPLVLDSPYEQLLPFIASLAYISLIPFSDNAIPVLVVVFRALVLLLAGLFVNKLNSIAQESAEAADRAEEYIRYSEALLNKAPQGTIVYQLHTDNRLTFVWSNEAFNKIFGVDSNQFVGKTVEEAFPQLVSTEFPNAYRRVASTGKSFTVKSVEFVEEEVEGTFDIYAFQIGTGRVAVFFLDTTKTNEVEQSLRQNEARYRNIVDIAEDAIVSVDEDHNIILFNNGAEKTFGYKPKEILGKPLNQLLPEFLRYKHKNHMQAFATSPTASRVMGEHIRDVSGKHKDGSLFPVEARISKINPDGHKIFTAILRDVSERKRSEAQIQSQLNKLSALKEIEMAITGTVDLRITLNIILEQVLAKLQVDGASVFLMDQDAGILDFAAGLGVDSQAFKNLGLHVGDGYSGRAILERKSIFVPDLNDPNNDIPRPTPLKGFRSLYSEPLTVRGRVLGVLEMLQRKPFMPDQDWKNFAEALARQTAIAIDNALLFETMQRSNDELSMAYRSTLLGWSKALELRDDETEGHTQRVKDMTLRLAKAFGITGEKLRHIRHGALLHDIGKIAVPDNILLKPGPLDDEEWELMKSHPQHAKDMITPIDYLRPAMSIPYSHHEKWDGSGYPERLKGEQIPLAARIFAVVDVWDALRSDRPYRKAWSEKKTLEYIREQSGSHFDPEVVVVFLSLLEGDKKDSKSRGALEASTAMLTD